MCRRINKWWKGCDHSTFQWKYCKDGHPGFPCGKDPRTWEVIPDRVDLSGKGELKVFDECCSTECCQGDINKHVAPIEEIEETLLIPKGKSYSSQQVKQKVRDEAQAAKFHKNKKDLPGFVGRHFLKCLPRHGRGDLFTTELKYERGKDVCCPVTLKVPDRPEISQEQRAACENAVQEWKNYNTTKADFAYYRDEWQLREVQKIKRAWEYPGNLRSDIETLIGMTRKSLRALGGDQTEEEVLRDLEEVFSNMKIASRASKSKKEPWISLEKTFKSLLSQARNAIDDRREMVAAGRTLGDEESPEEYENSEIEQIKIAELGVTSRASSGQGLWPRDMKQMVQYVRDSADAPFVPYSKSSGDSTGAGETAIDISSSATSSTEKNVTDTTTPALKERPPSLQEVYRKHPTWKKNPNNLQHDIKRLQTQIENLKPLLSRAEASGQAQATVENSGELEAASAKRLEYLKLREVELREMNVAILASGKKDRLIPLYHSILVMIASKRRAARAAVEDSANTSSGGLDSGAQLGGSRGNTSLGGAAGAKVGRPPPSDSTSKPTHPSSRKFTDPTRSETGTSANSLPPQHPLETSRSGSRTGSYHGSTESISGHPSRRSTAGSDDVPISSSPHPGIVTGNTPTSDRGKKPRSTSSRIVLDKGKNTSQTSFRSHRSRDSQGGRDGKNGGAGGTGYGTTI